MLPSPRSSPNTDGIHMGASSNISIVDSNIDTGDDCVSIGSGNANVTVSGVRCGPGHGISGGSLGKGADKGDVIGLTVKNCTINQMMIGIMIKTWQSKPRVGGAASTRVSNFRFEDIVMNNVSNPIIVDQEYFPYHSCPKSDVVVVDRFYGVGNAIDQHQDTRMDTDRMLYEFLKILSVCWIP